MAASRRKSIIAVIITLLVAVVAATAILLFSTRTVSIRFETGNGPAISNIVLKVGETADRPADPIHDDPGYSFGGWYMDENYTVEFDWDMPIEQTTTVFVKWRPESFTVRVVRETNGGFDEILYRASGDYTSTITLPSETTAEAPNEDLDPVYNFLRHNQDFKGFAYDRESARNYYAPIAPGATFTIPNRNTELFAVFRGKESSFQFDSNEGSGAVSDQVGYFNEYFEIPSADGLTRKYYTFVCWNTEPDGTGDSYQPGYQMKITSVAPVTLYAIWERNQHNVTIDAMGGSGSIGLDGTNLVDAGSSYDLSTISQPVRDGYRLLSYNTQPDGLGATYALNDVVEVGDKEVILYAIWAKLITINFDYNGVSSPAIMDTFTGIVGESFTIEALPATVTRPNFDFQGWSLDHLANDATYKTGNTFTILPEYEEDQTLYAVWLGVPRTLVFDNNGGGNGNSEVNKTHGFRYQIDKQAKHIDNGYKFVGWNTAANGTGITYQLGEVFTIGDNLVEGKSVLYAMWEAETYTISYYLQGGTCSFDTTANPYVVSAKYKTNLTLIHAKSAIYREGYRFAGWGLSANAVEPEYWDVENGDGWNIQMAAGNMMLFAQWEKEYTITFDSNGGTGIIQPITNIIIGEEFTLPSTGFTRTNYDQIYWSDLRENGEQYALGQTMILESSLATTMYAVWQGQTRHIYVYDNINNSNWARDIVGRYGERMMIEFSMELTHTDPGYELKGFALNPYDTVDNIRYQYGDSDFAPEAESLKIYAIWAKKSFNIYYELEGGLYGGQESMADYNATLVYESQSYIPGITPTKEKHTFLGWCEDPTGATGTLYQPDASFNVPSHDVIFYAVWARSYTLRFDPNGGELADELVPVNEITAGKGLAITLNDVTLGGSFVRENYNFVGWNTRQDGGGDSYPKNSQYTINSDTVLYATWQGVNVPLSINTGSATNITISPTPRYGDVIDLSTRMINPPREGLELVGFADEDDPDTVVWTNEYVVNDVTRNVIYAVWTPKTYVLIIRLEGGVYDRSYEDIKLNVKFEEEIDLSDYSSEITQSGYELTGFKNKQSSIQIDYRMDDIFVMPAANKTIYCHWEKLAVYTFNSNTGASSTTEVRTYVAGERDTAPTLAREHYTFIGWSQVQTATTADAGMFAGNQFQVTALVDITYYAVWQGDPRTVVLSGNGAPGVVDQQINARYGDSINLSNRSVSRSDTAGYEFAGWSTSEGDNAADTISGDYIVECEGNSVTLYAVWARKNFTIRFYNNGKQIKSIVRQFESNVELSGEYVLTQTGYTFLGWAENELEIDPTKMYTAARAFTIPDQDVNLYAIWDPQEVNIYFQNDDTENPGVVYQGEANATKSFKLVGLKDLTIELPTNYKSTGNGMYRTKYKFIGWKLKINEVLQPTLYLAGSKFTVFQENPDDEIFFFAQWDLNRIEVVINADGGNILNESGDWAGTKTQQIVENETLTLPTIAEINRSGYRLMYFTTKDGNQYAPSTAATPTTIVISNSLLDKGVVTVRAVWMPQFTVTFLINVPTTEINNGIAGGTTAAITVDSGEFISMPTSSFFRNNYHFDSWNANSLGTAEKLNAGASKQITNNLTYYAIWIGNNRTVDFNFNGGKFSGINGVGAGQVTYSVATTYGTVINLVDYQGVSDTDGLILEGWKLSPTDTALYKRATDKYLVEGTDAVSTIVLYASWAAKSYDLTYDANGGIFGGIDGTPETRSNTAAFGSEVIISDYDDSQWIPSNPQVSPAAYEFVGWSTDPKISHTATKSNNLSMAAVQNNIIYTPKPEGYDNTTCHGFTMPAKNLVLYAVWKPYPWTLNYNSEGSLVQTVTQDYGLTITLSTVIPTKENHEFTCWVHVLEDGTEVEYAAGAMFQLVFDNMTTTEQNYRTINFEARFTPQSVRVRLMANEGFFSDGSDQKIIDTFVGYTIKMPLVQEAEGSEYQLNRAYYAYTGFAEDPTGEGSLNLTPGYEYQVPPLTSSYIMGGELILYAQWTVAEAYIYKGDDPDLNTYYSTLKAAISNASSGDLVYLLSSCTISSYIEVKTDVTLLLDGTMLPAGTTTMTISRAAGYTDNLFRILPIGTLSLGYVDGGAAYDLIINGNNRVTSAASIFNVQGKLNFYAGVKVTGARGINGAVAYVDNSGASVLVKYAIIEANQANNGGAFYINNGELVIDESAQIVSNSSESDGGAIYNKGTVLISNDEGIDKGIEIKDNQAFGKGGFIYNLGSVNFTQVTISNNSATEGGAIYNATNGIIQLTTVTFTTNSASSKGGAIYNGPVATGVTSNNATLSGCVFGSDENTGNTASELGGAICNAGNMEINEESMFIGNKTEQPGSSGGAIANEDGKLLILNVEFQLNSVALNGQGGALTVTNGEVTIGTAGVADTKVEFFNNTSVSGEGLAISTSNGTLNLNNVEIYNHQYESATYAITNNGGVLFMGGGTVNANGLLMYDNMTTLNGGAIFAYSGTLNLNNAELFRNTATNGGAIYVKGSAVVAGTKADIYQNEAKEFESGVAGQGLGGAIYTSSANVTLLGVNIGNATESVGNMAIDGAGIYATAQVSINGTKFNYNVASGNGGAIWTSANLLLYKADFDYNIAEYYGGAIYTCGNSIVKFSDTTYNAANAVIFRGNSIVQTTDGAGHGLYAVNNVEMQGTVICMTALGQDDIYLANLDDEGNPKDVYIVRKNTMTAACRINVTCANTQIGAKLADMGLAGHAKTHLKYFMYNGNAGGVRVRDKYIINGDYSALIETGGDPYYYSSLRLAYLDTFDTDKFDSATTVVIKLSRDIDLEEDLRTDPGIDASADLDTPFDITRSVAIVSEAEYKITRGGMTGYMFEVTGAVEFVLGVAAGDDGSILNIIGDYDPLVGGDPTGSIIHVMNGSSFKLYDTVTLKGNLALEGGAITNSGTATLYGGVITENFANNEDPDTGVVTGKGGAIYNNSTGVLTVGNTTITLNESNAYGGGIYNNGGTVNITGANALISENIATISGGGVYTNGGMVSMGNGKITKNTTTSTKVDNNTFVPGGAGVAISGGATFSMTSDASTPKAYVTENTSQSSGGGLAVYNGSIDIQSGYITKNLARNAYGGGIYFIKLNETDTHIMTLTSKAYITENTANYGGGVAFVGITLEITGDFRVSANTANSRGGGVMIAGTETYNSNITFNSSAIHIGKSGEVNSSKDGGGVYVFNGSTLTISRIGGNNGAGISYNAASGNGGGIYNDGTLNFQNAAADTSVYFYISWNTAANGGAIYNDSKGVVTGNNFRIENNTANSVAGGGGAVYNKGTFTVAQYQSTASYFGSGATTLNVAKGSGGGLYNEGSFKVTTYQPDASGRNYNGALYITNNTAVDFGGGIYNLKGDFLVDNGRLFLTDNEQKSAASLFGGGGGMAIADGTFTAITKYVGYDTAVTDITRLASGYGGAYISTSGNLASGYGAGWLTQGGTTKVNEVYFAKNKTMASGGAAAFVSGEFILEEGYSNVYCGMAVNLDNEATMYGSDLFLDTKITIKNNLVGNWRIYNYNDFRGTTYLNSTKAYIEFATKADGKSSYAPSSTTYKLTIESHTAGYVDGRRMAYFGTYEVEEPVDGEDADGNPIQVVDIVTKNLAETYYKRFDVKLPSGTVFGVNFDDLGYVVLSAPVAVNLSKHPDKYYATLDAATVDASNGDYIEIIRSHTLYTNVTIENKGIHFLIQTNIILTRAKNFPNTGALFFINNTTDGASGYSVYFNEKYTWGGVTYGNGVTLTLDGNKVKPKTESTVKSSLIFVSGMKSRAADGSINHGQYYSEWSSYKDFNAPARTNLYIYNSRLINNKSYHAGGAISYYGFNGAHTSASAYNSKSSSLLEIRNCTFDNNETWRYGPTKLTAAYNKYTGGGAIFAEGGHLRVYDSTFTNNHTGASGGAIRAIGQAYYADKADNMSYALVIQRSTFSNNSANDTGGALSLNPIYNSVNLGADTTSETNKEFVSLVNNTAKGEGGAIYWAPVTPSSFDAHRAGITPTGTTNYHLVANTAVNTQDRYQRINQVNRSGPYYDEVSSKQIMPYLRLNRTCTIDGNKSVNSSGGGVRSMTGLYVYGALITNNEGYNGGGIYTDGWFLIGNTPTISNNVARHQGGGMYLGSTTTGHPYTPYTGYTGGKEALYYALMTELKKDIIVLDTALITGNQSAKAGGGVFCYSKKGISTDTTTFSNNKSGTIGGGVYLEYKCGNNYFYKTSFIGNEATNCGGGFATSEDNDSDAPVFWECTIDGNKAGKKGGGLYLYNGGTIQNCVITNNEVVGTAENYNGGGGVWAWNFLRICGSTTMTGNQITGTALKSNSGGGAIWAYAREEESKGYLQFGQIYYNTQDYLIDFTAYPELYSSYSSYKLSSYHTYRGELFYYLHYSPFDKVYSYNKGVGEYYVWGSENSNQTTQDLNINDVRHYPITACTARVAGNNTASGWGDGVFAYGRGYFSLVIANAPTITDDMYIYKCCICVPTYLNVDDSRSYSVYFPNDMKSWSMMIFGSGASASTSQLTAFRVVDPSGASIKCQSDYDLSWTRKSVYESNYSYYKSVRRCHLVTDTITFRVWDNSYVYRPATNDVDTNNYPLVSKTATSGQPNYVYYNGWFSTEPTSGAYIQDGVTTTHYKTVSATVGQSFKAVYDQVLLLKPGASFAYFYLCEQRDYNGNNYSYTRIWSYFSLSERIRSQSEYEAARISSTGGFSLFVMWNNTSYTITIAKLLNNKDSRDSYRCAETHPSGMGNYYGNFTYKMYSNETFEGVIEYVNTTINDKVSGSNQTYKDPVTNQEVPINYYNGYTYEYFTISIDRKIYVPTDRYPYAESCTLYLVYSKTEYQLEYTIGEEDTVEVDGKDYTVGGGSWVIEMTDPDTGSVIAERYQYCLSDKTINMLSSTMIKKTGCKLVGWYSEDTNKVYNLTAAYGIRQHISLIPVWEPVPYTLRVYFNYPSGGSNFMLYSVNGNTSITQALTNFRGEIDGYDPNGFSYDALGTDMLNETDMMPTNDLIVYAQWKPIDLEIVYLDIYGNEWLRQSIKFGQAFQLSAVMPDGSPKKIWKNEGTQLAYAPGSTYTVENVSSLYLRFIAGT